MIILEGVDATGKTYLANKLHTIGFTVVKCSQPKPGKAYEEYVTKILNADHFTVFDRHFIGELVYGPAKRGVCQLNDAEVMNIIRLLQARNAKVIYCDAPFRFIKEAFIERGEAYTLIGEVHDMQKRYLKVLKFIEQHLVVQRFKVRSPIEKLRSVLDHHEKITAANCIVRSRYCGSLSPDVLFVGLENNLQSSKSKATVLPFDFGRSSDMLRKAIALAEIKSFGLINLRTSFAKTPDYLIHHVIEELNPRVIVCLGDDVYDELKRYDRSVKVPHPSYVARFKRQSIKQYATQIKKVCQR